MVQAVEDPAGGVRVLEVPRSASRERDQLAQFVFGQATDAELLRLGELGAGVLAGHHVAGLLADRRR